MPTLRGAGVGVEPLAWKRLFDVNPARRLRELVNAYRPDLLHVWGMPSLRAVWLTGGGDTRRLVVSASPHQTAAAVPWNLLDRWLLRGADRVIACHAREAEYFRDLGIVSEKIVHIRPGAALSSERKEPRAEFLRSFRLPGNARLLVCVGPLEPAKGFVDAIWAFDILRYLYNDLHLVLVGDGSDRPRLERFVRVIQAGTFVHFVGTQQEVSTWLAQAEVVWVPGHTASGMNVALEALAAGRPVVAARLPELVELVADNESGFLITPGDKAELALKTRLLLDDPGQCARMGQAGLRQVTTGFAAAHLAQAFAQLYEAVLA